MVPTSLALTLRGVVSKFGSANAVAVVAGPDQRDVPYHVGDAMPGGSMLDAIYPTHVVLLNNGRRELLAMADREEARALDAPKNAATNSAKSDRDLPLGEVNVLPAIDGNSIIGARISPPDVALIERAGLRRDDVIISIDGVELSGPDSKEALAKRLRQGGNVTLVLRRDGREQEQNVYLGP